MSDWTRIAVLHQGFHASSPRRSDRRRGGRIENRWGWWDVVDREEEFNRVRLGLEAEWVIVYCGGNKGDCVWKGWVRVPVGEGLDGV